MRPESLTGDDVGVVVPLRSFAVGKARLASHLTPVARRRLSRRLADRVVDAAGSRPVVVVSSAPEVAEWASDRGLARIDDPGSLDAAAGAGRRWVSERGLARVVVAHGDLPFVTSLDPVATGGSEPVAVIVPCHRGDGTPVLSVPVHAPFRFAYGPGSFARHIAEAERAGLEPRILRDESLGFDVDLPEDLATLVARAGHRP